MIEKLQSILEILLKDLDDENKIKMLESTIIQLYQFDRRILINKEIIGVNIKTKTTKSHLTINKGQIFEIFLEGINKFNYCVIIDAESFEGNGKNDKILVGYLNTYSSERLTVTEICRQIEQFNFRFYACTGITGFKSKKWVFVTEYNNLIDIDPKTIKYKINFMGKNYKSVGDPIKSIVDCEVITDNECNEIQNPLGIVGEKEIEHLLVEYSKY
ncbi:hypothetical protein FZW96_00010 [Bacillus sp. BGMRC 2118]|nr:hypothetical protein FZW96_00010 [Bacillus sp. BGMRC 2118]